MTLALAVKRGRGKSGKTRTDNQAFVTLNRFQRNLRSVKITISKLFFAALVSRSSNGSYLLSVWQRDREKGTGSRREKKCVPLLCCVLYASPGAIRLVLVACTLDWLCNLFTSDREIWIFEAKFTRSLPLIDSILALAIYEMLGANNVHAAPVFQSNKIILSWNNLIGLAHSVSQSVHDGRPPIRASRTVQNRF